ncbi:hypothetical protein SSS_07224 [Sarcoptes scabiei]|uniref:Uncharacterized protein n=1 Tax=Sarcoptes scabiei TaxID=52283 RepID=A0A834VFP7_SARSC|nr:hypothetical protein SSS_07224 [Sarcoptes scabiei]
MEPETTLKMSENETFKKSSLSIVYDPEKENLHFDECDINLYINHSQLIALNKVIIIRHFERKFPYRNLHQDRYEYLHYVFKEFFNRTQNTEKFWKPNRTSLLALFHSHKLFSKYEPRSVDSHPIYAVFFEVDSIDDQNYSIQIGFRRITGQSFLINTLDLFCRPVLEQNIRRCVVIETKKDSMGEKDEHLIMRASVMNINHTTKRISQRMFLIAKHGWLAVFLKNHHETFLLLEDEYLIVSDSLKSFQIFYERILDTNQANDRSDSYYRRTALNQDQFSNSGMIVNRGVFQNEFKTNSFTLNGFGNAIINLNYFQQLLTASDRK